MSLFQRVSKVPVTNMSEPLSATMRPYVFMARKTFCTSGVKPEMSLAARRRRVAPLDPVRLRDGLGGDRIERHTHAVALVEVEQEVHRELGLGAVHDRVGHPIDLRAPREHLAAEVGVQVADGAVVDEADEAGRV